MTLEAIIMNLKHLIYIAFSDMIIGQVSSGECPKIYSKEESVEVALYAAYYTVYFRAVG